MIMYFYLPSTALTLVYYLLAISFLTLFAGNSVGQAGAVFSTLGIAVVTFDQLHKVANLELLIFSSLALFFNLLTAQICEISVHLKANEAHWKNETEKLKRLQNSFLANMSHELRTPLTAIMGYTDILISRHLEENGSSDVPVELSVMKKSEDNLLEALNSIFDFSRVLLSEKILAQDEISVAKFFNEVCAPFQLHAKSKKLFLRLSIQGSVPDFIKSDKIAIKQIVIHLLENAIKFTQRGGITLKVDFLQIDLNAKLHFSIEDTGIGVAHEKIHGLFTAFFQEESSMSRRFGGLGLGLAFCSKLIDMLGGTLSVKSQKNRGTRFDVEIPVIVTSKIETTLNQVDISNHDSPVLNSTQKKVLIVDDTADNAILMSYFLKQQDMAVECVENGKLAVDMIFEKKNVFDLVLMDMQMPVMDGYQATKILRQRGFKIPIIAVTAHCAEGEKEKCLTSGCTDYISKPLTKKTFIEKVSSSLKV